MSVTRKFRCGVVALALSVLTLVGCSVPFVSEREIEIESRVEFEKMKASMPIETDAGTRAYVFCVAQAIINELEPPYSDLDWEIEIFDDKEMVNAFAMTGGKIGVFTGILDVAKTEDQLGAVMGHEVAHVTEQHALERVNREITTQGGAIAGAAILGGGVAGDLVKIGAALGLSLPYGRKQESEADTVGLNYMSDAGFDPRASVQLWKNMEEKSGRGPPQFISTHPSPDNRIEKLIENLPAALVQYNKAQALNKNPQCSY